MGSGTANLFPAQNCCSFMQPPEIIYMNILKGKHNHHSYNVLHYQNWIRKSCHTQLLRTRQREFSLKKYTSHSNCNKTITKLLNKHNDK
jgi:hypothetical protein